MKKFIATMMMAAMIAVMLPLTGSAQTRSSRSSRSSRNRSYTSQTYNRPNFYERHRNLINVGIGTGAGAILGGLFGGRKGALIGTAVGAGGSALYTYKINPKDGRRYRVYR